ncbi:3-oxoacyl-ACP synthase [Flammeovirgaceae bacterium SG7u.111]|nr:3-oxoacyl-ACP synthase [Flammeovirgaceae bacterium SG7u.132]WPO36187.1 3-oxoacyl-ACP synthase [Flammeovirgaceae bacterium SG7u.111]
MELTIELKKQAHAACLEMVNERVDTAKSAMDAAQAAANEDTKSSAGDKYETGRAMMMLEKEKNAAQLEEAAKLKKVLIQLNPEKICTQISPGSLFQTTTGFFYLAVGLGKIETESLSFFAISPASPIAQQLRGLKVGESTSFNGNTFKIIQVL